MNFYTFLVVLLGQIFCCLSIGHNSRKSRHNFDLNNEFSDNCNLSTDLASEIKSYESIANEIYLLYLNRTFKGKSYKDLGEFVDKFGSRFTGTKSLEDAIDYMTDKMRQASLENVHGEIVEVPRWVRGYEYAEMTQPRRKKLSILGLGWSSGTPVDGVEAEILIVNGFEELQRRADEVPGKIVVYNSVFVDYAITSQFRKLGAFRAAKLGAVASLTRSVAPFSLNSPHTGAVFDSSKDSGMTIPAACITLEDADLFQRLIKSGHKVVVKLIMNDYMLPPSNSSNSVGDIRGYEKPDEIVIVSAHIDSWDVGQGAMDDGGGVIITLNALEALQFLGLRPRRTIRMILWTGEEMGYFGAKEYLRRHREELANISVLMESDAATFRPLGLGFAGSEKAGCIMKHVANLLKPLNASSYDTFTKISSDVDVFVAEGVPGISLRTELTKRYFYHHTEADTFDKEDTDELNLCAAVWTATTYILADLSIPLPR